jgi:amino acid transporter
MAPPPEQQSLLNRILGRPIETEAAPRQTIGKTVGLAVFASDALSSVAYASEEILLVLAVAGSALFGLALPIAGAIGVLLIILTLSYRQTIFAYPGGGGAYIVSRDNLGIGMAQVAGAALLTDYVLTVSVSIASGVAQLTSAIAPLRPYQIELCIAMIVVMTVANLRGVKESGRVFAGPTYFFIAMSLLMLAVGGARALTGTLPVVEGVRMIAHDTLQPLSLFLVLRAFSSGCTALTGVEAISNGIPAFREPRTRNAASTMAIMSGILLVLFMGITALALQVRAVPSADETVISQLSRTVFGGGAGYALMTAATTGILIMAANTSYADFPRLCALIASDGFLPRQLTWRGRRLAFSWGIVALAGLASLLLVVFQGDTHLLIPLYAIGVFTSFTLSQAGMVRHWQRAGRAAPGSRPQHWRLKQAINALGCGLTAVVTGVFGITKFGEGAWIVVLLIPALIATFFRIQRHYQRVASRLSLQARPIDVRAHPMETIVLVNDVHQGTLQMISYAESLGKPWVAIHVAQRPEKTARVVAKWEQYLGSYGQLYVLPSPYRSLTAPIAHLVDEIRREHPGAFVNIIVAQLVTESRWTQWLHRNSGAQFKSAFVHMQGVAVTDIHFPIRNAGPASPPAQEEPARPAA